MRCHQRVKGQASLHVNYAGSDNLRGRACQAIDVLMKHELKKYIAS